jgi:hypothetical protein
LTALDDLLLLVSEAAIIFLGGVLVYVSMRAYRRTKSRSMLALSLGFAVIIMQPLVEEVFLYVFRNPMLEAHILRNLIVAVGLLIIVYSIYGNRG